MATAMMLAALSASAVTAQEKVGFVVGGKSAVFYLPL